jgi:hypothetical protein
MRSITSAPIPEPTGLPGPADRRLFRLRFWPYFWFNLSVVVGCLFPALGLLLFTTPARATTTSSFTTIIIFVTIGMGLASTILGSILYVCLNRVEVSERGVKLSTALDLGRSLQWEQITRVRPIRWLWLRLLRLDTPRKTYVVWLPLYLHDKQGFWRAIGELAPPDNELRRWIDSGL